MGSMGEAGGSVVRPALVGPRLRPGDRVRVVSPASTPGRGEVAQGVELLRSWGLVVELGEHVFDQVGHYLAGTDEDRLADINDAFRDRGVRAVLTTRGGKGSYRIANAIDFEAVRRDPKPLVGFSDITFLHQALYHHCGIATLHGPHIGWSEQFMGPFPADSLRGAMMTTGPVTLHQQPGEASAPLTTGGRATGTLLGGNLRGVGQSVGWGPSYNGAILALEAIDLMPGEIDGTLTRIVELRRSRRRAWRGHRSVRPLGSASAGQVVLPRHSRRSARHSRRATPRRALLRAWTGTGHGPTGDDCIARCRSRGPNDRGRRALTEDAQAWSA